MKASYLNLVLAPIFVTACAHSSPAPEEHVETPGKLTVSDPIFIERDPESKSKCKADAECPTGDYCHPDQLVCFQSYPNPRMLDISFNVEPVCKIVNVYFPYDSVELVPGPVKGGNYDIADPAGDKTMIVDPTGATVTLARTKTRVIEYGIRKVTLPVPTVRLVDSSDTGIIASH